MKSSVKKDQAKSIYKIDHFYNGNTYQEHDELCLVIKSIINISDIVEILGCIELKFEQLIDESIVADEEHILNILKEFYDAEDVKQEYKEYLKYTHIPKSEWETVNIFELTKENIKIIQIDLYEAREFCCGRSEKFMENVLPKDEKFESYIKSLKDFYYERFEIKNK